MDFNYSYCSYNTRPFIYQLSQLATKYRVKIKLLNCLAFSKSHGKTIKTVRTRLDKKYCLKLVIIVSDEDTSKLFEKAATQLVNSLLESANQKVNVIVNNRCLKDKRCFRGLNIFLFENRSAIFGAVPLCRQLIL